jgi:Concanavalin A-like lectin/glucanases superfamily
MRQYCGSIIEKGYDNTNEAYYLRYFHNDGQTLLQTGAYNGSNHLTQWVMTFGANSWHHVVGQYDGARWNLYVDGALVSSSEGAIGPQSASAPVSIGAASISGSFARFFQAL